MERTNTIYGDVVWNTCPPIPDGTKPLDHQVAGHIFGRHNGHKKNQLGFLQDNSGCILKPVQAGTKGLRERRFYEFISKQFENETHHKKFIVDYLNKESSLSKIPSTFDDTEDICKQIRRLKKFVPVFYGLWTTPVHPGVSYMTLENVTNSMKKPCVMDVKVGCVTYDRNADEDKIKRELSKCPALMNLGFQIVGIKVYSSTTKDYRVLERHYLRSLDQNDIMEKGLAVYFNGSFKNQLLLKVFLGRLKDISEWFEEQRALIFIASSLLFVYDGCMFDAGGGGGGCKDVDDGEVDGGLIKGLKVNSYSGKCSEVKYDDSGTTGDLKQDDISGGNATFTCHHACHNDEEYARLIHQLTDVKMIDFSHVFPSEDKKDTNYLEGLRSLIKYIERLL